MANQSGVRVIHQSTVVAVVGVRNAEAGTSASMNYCRSTYKYLVGTEYLLLTL